MGSPRPTADHDGQSTVVLVDCAGGSELEVVRDMLVRSWRTPTVLIRGGDLADLEISLDPDRGLLTVDGVRVRPAVVWARHCATCAIAAQAQPAGAVSLLDAAAWSTLFRHLETLAHVVLPGNAPAGPAQLTAAENLGVKIPRTVVTNDVSAGARQLGASRIVVKTPDFRLLQPDPSTWAPCLPEILDARAGPGGRPAGGRPVVVQEYVPHLRELRVYHLDGGICAFEVGLPEPATMWTDPAAVTVTRVDCPPAVAAAVRALSASWDLRYGAYDLLVTRTGEPVFLEVNPDGDWLFYERRAGWHGVSFMAAVMVRELFVRAGECVAG